MRSQNSRPLGRIGEAFSFNFYLDSETVLLRFEREFCDRYIKDTESHPTRFQGGKEGTLWYYNSIAEIAKQTQGSFLETEIIRVVEKLQSISG